MSRTEIRITGFGGQGVILAGHIIVACCPPSTAQARPNESLMRFCQRTGNQWSPALTAAINGLTDGTRLSGLRLKIAVRRPAY